jgi:hypothetical protein
VSTTAVSAIKEWFTNSIGELMRAALNLLVTDNDYHHLNYALQSVGVAIGTTVTRARSTIAGVVMAGGVFSASKVATDDEFILTGAVVPVSSFNKYLLMRDAANVASIVEGIPASTAAGVRFPALPTNKACVGYVQVATNGATTFTPGVTALNAAGITATFVNGLDSAMLRVMQVNAIQ